MFAPRWSKVIRDLTANRTRTLLVVLSIGVGVFAFGTIMAARVVLTRDLRSTFLATNPASGSITTQPFDASLVDAARRVPGVADAAGQQAVAARLLLPDGDRVDMQLFVLDEVEDLRINIVAPESGAWPPPDKAILIERASLRKIEAAVGDSIQIELAGATPRSIPVAGLTHDLSLPPAVIAGQAFAYITPDTLEWLGGKPGMTKLLFTVSEGRSDKAHIQQIATQLERLVERSGRTALVTDVPTPLQHPVEVILPTMLALMTVIGSLALVISGFLIMNTISAILTQQTRQIGIMKSLGASTTQIMGLYFTLSAAFGALALLIAVPLGAVGAFTMTRFIGDQLNVDIQGFGMPVSIVLVQVLTAILVPVLTAALPIRAAASMTVRDALSGDTTAPSAHSPFDHLLNRFTAITRPTRLALRNTFRRRGRLARTLIALALGGAVMISALSLRAALYTTLDASIASQQYDLEIQFSRSYRAEDALKTVRSVPGVTDAEAMRRGIGFPVHADGSTGEGVGLRAIPADTAMIRPEVIAGRWLIAGDERAIVLASNFLLKEPNISVGSQLVLQINDRNETWTVVGMVNEFIPPTMPAVGYLPLSEFTRISGANGRTDTLRVATAGHDPLSHSVTAQALERHLQTEGFELRQIRSRSEDRAILDERFNLLTTIMTIMSIIIGGVGGLGLMGTMSINVLERTREIGVMRAIGAGDDAIEQIVLTEGWTIGVMSWVMASIIAIPMGYAMCYGFGMALLNTPLFWRYSFPGSLVWLGIVLAISTAASYLPARSASQLTVREVLAYE